MDSGAQEESRLDQLGVQLYSIDGVERQDALRSLADHPSPKAVEILGELLPDASKYGHDTAAVIGVLEMSAKAEAVDPLQRVWDNPKSDQRRRAADALAGLAKGGISCRPSTGLTVRRLCQALVRTLATLPLIVSLLMVFVGLTAAAVGEVASAWHDAHHPTATCDGQPMYSGQECVTYRQGDTPNHGTRSSYEEAKNENHIWSWVSLPLIPILWLAAVIVAVRKLGPFCVTVCRWAARAYVPVTFWRKKH